MMLRQIALSCALGATASFAQTSLVVEEIVAKVNGDIVTRGELEKSKRQLEQAARAQRAADADKLIAEREKDILKQRIDELLLVSRSKELNINVDSEFSKYQAELMRQFKATDTDQFAKLVREQTGQSYEDWRNEVKNGMLTQRVVRQEVSSKINIGRDDVKKYYDEHQKEFVRQEQIFLREIFLSTDGKTPDQQAAIQKKAGDLVARARKGERFPELARDNSESATAQQGGEIGAAKKGEMAKEIEDLLWNQPKGYVTDPIKRPNGYLILRVEEHFKEGQAALEEVEQEIMGRLYEPRMAPAMKEYLTKLRMDAFLEIREGYEDSGAAPGKNTRWTDPAQLKPQTITKKELEAKGRRRRLLWTVPIPGTSTAKKDADLSTAAPAAPTNTTAPSTVGKEGESKSKTVKQ